MSLEKFMWATGQPVFHFKPIELSNFLPPKFPVWNADIENSGWYGFPVNHDGILKAANHGPGWKVDPRQPRIIPDNEEDRFREFFASTFPDLANAPIAGQRLCLYCDTWDGNFWIDHDPSFPGLIVSTGGCGHGFKFAPLLGVITADVLEKKDNKFSSRFSWRKKSNLKKEDARFNNEIRTSYRK